ncbi:hypothetical protein HJG53_07975 [Sphingomonas sp. ID1715]|uniref:hypothetical protein n=1 Tax=Sphingomonas sp. ID1715 TaxID=1656898 RepID=UPI0014877D89|nr:hypothetical protein [Sphingomonas sp. ID1715]NNM76833.1 hypothetical protein [Sphingomonas sp. ID1715]
MSDHVDSVKSYLRLLEGWRETSRAKGDDKMVATYDKRIAFMQAAVDEIEHLRRITKPIPASYGDLSDLPDELIKELTGIKVDDLEQQVFTIIKAGGAEVDLDSVLIELFRRFKVVQTRRYLQNKLWRMAQKGLIFSVAGKKGVYTADRPEADTAAPRAAPSPFDDFDDDVPF